MARRSDSPVSDKRRNVVKGIVAGGGVAATGGLISSCVKHPAEELADARADLDGAIRGRTYWREDEGYEVTRGKTAYRVNKPNRYPSVIVQPAHDRDVQQAVRFAAKHRLRVTTRSGGHSWSASHIRDDCMLIDMSRMQSLMIDRRSRTLWTNPGVLGSRINSALGPNELIIPTAHHPSPGIGGFVMNGGFGWNSRLWGTGAAHLRAIDVVTADGELIRADENQNTDYLWAARGSGAGFFGVVTNMHLTCRPLPPVMRFSVYLFNDEVLEDLFAWAREAVAAFPPYLEVIMSTTAYDPSTGDWAPVRLVLAGVAMTDSEEAADAALDTLRTCPVLDKAYFRIEKKDTNLNERYASGYSADPAGHRFAVDNIYTEAPGDVLVPRMRKLFTDLPSPRSHVFWMSWGPTKPFPDDMALSVQGDIYLAAYSLWTEPADDERMEMWPVSQIRELDDLSMGGQMNDENMFHHPQKYLSAEAYKKLEALRARHDPDGVFETFMGQPYRPV